MSYTVLRAAIQDTTQSYDATFVANLDRFIQLAERQIYTEAKLPAVQVSAAVTLTAGSRSLTIPTDLITTRSISIDTINGKVNLIPKAPSFLEELYPDTTLLTAPKYYAQENATTFSVAPTPDLSYAGTLKYAGVPASIVTASSTWLDTTFPQTLLYCAVLHAYVFLKGNVEVMQMYKAAYDMSLKELVQVMQDTHQDGFR